MWIVHCWIYISILTLMRVWSIKYVPLDVKDEIIIGLLQQVKDLEGQVKERREWAQQSVAQAITKVANYVTEKEKGISTRKGETDT